MIRFDGVTKRYPDGTVAVGGLDLIAPTGRITVLVGPSGCGKTTSLRMVNRMIEPTGGRITIDIAKSVPAVQGLPEGMIFHQGHRPWLAELVKEAGLHRNG